MARGRADTDAGPAFELHRFAVTAAAADAVLVELEGRWSGGAPAAGRSRLLAGEDDDQRSLAPAAEAVGGRTWRATFAVPAPLAGLPLAVAGAGYVVDLPDPDPPGPEDQRIARLAREGNHLRRGLEVAEERAAHADALGRERDELRGDLEAAAAEAERLQAEAATDRDTLRARVGELEAELDATRQEADARVAAERERLERHLSDVVAEHGDERRRLEARLIEIDRDRQAEREELQAVHAAELARLAEEYEAGVVLADEEREDVVDDPDGLAVEHSRLLADRDALAARVTALERELAWAEASSSEGPGDAKEPGPPGRSPDPASAPTTIGPQADATTNYGPAADRATTHGPPADAPTTIDPASRGGADRFADEPDDDVPTAVARRPRWAGADNGASAASRPAFGGESTGEDDDLLDDEDDEELGTYEGEPITPPAHRGAPRSARTQRSSIGSGSPGLDGEVGRWIAVALLLVGLVLVGFIVTGLLR